jgi:hypothetical protein
VYDVVLLFLVKVAVSESVPLNDGEMVAVATDVVVESVKDFVLLIDGDAVVVVDV